MSALIRVLAGLLLVAHGLVHLLYVSSEAQDPTYAFSLHQSWLIPDSARRTTGVVLMTATVVGFALAALAAWGVPRLSHVWPPLTITAAGLSLVLLIGFFDVQLLFGVTIDIALIVLALSRPAWTAAIGG